MKRSGRRHHLPCYQPRCSLGGKVSEPSIPHTLADANEVHDWRIFADFADVVIAVARPLYANDSIGLDLDQTLYALDSTRWRPCWRSSSCATAAGRYEKHRRLARWTPPVWLYVSVTGMVGM